MFFLRPVHRHVADGTCPRSAGRVSREIPRHVRSLVPVLVARPDAQLPVDTAASARRLHWRMCARVGEHPMLGEAAGFRRRRNECIAECGVGGGAISVRRTRGAAAAT